jgi:hypothetical protein
VVVAGLLLSQERERSIAQAQIGCRWHPNALKSAFQTGFARKLRGSSRHLDGARAPGQPERSKAEQKSPMSCHLRPHHHGQGGFE